MYNNISLFFSANCNMKCKYCDVNDCNIDLNKYNNELREAISTGKFYDNIIKNYGHLKEEIIELALWGLEPTINIDLYNKLLIPLLDYYNNVNELMFSTNAFLGYNSIKDFILSLENYSRPIKLELQFSLDGPEWVNDFSRRKGATKRTIQMIKDTIYNNQSNSNLTIRLLLKPTLDCHFMKILNEDKEKFNEYFTFFLELKKELDALNHTNKIITPPLGNPTLVIPHYHTIEDGKIFAKFIYNLNKFEKENNLEQPFFTQIFDNLSIGNTSICSAGLYTLSIDYKGEIYGCHSLYSQAYKQENDKTLNSNISSFKNKKREVQKRQQLIHNYPESREGFMDIILYKLAKEKQIQKKFLFSKELKKILYNAIINIYCCYGHLATTKSVWIPTTSYFKLLGNGALEQLILYYKKWREKDERN